MELTYCEDTDNDGFGNPGSETEKCDALVEAGWVLDCSDDFPDCELNADSDNDCADDCIDGTGDVNLDGALNVLDIQSIIFNIINPDLYIFNCMQEGIADYDQNGLINIVDLVNLIDLILGGGIARERSMLHQVDLSFTDNSIILEDNGFIALDMTLRHSASTYMEFNLSDKSIVGVCEFLSDTTSRCIIAMDQAGEIIMTTSPFDIIEITAAIPDGYVKVNLREMPMEYMIGNAYPNPFNPMVRFNYAIPISTDIIVKVYDIKGRMVSVLLDNTVEPGRYNLEWNAQEYSNGVYFIQFDMGGELTTQKVMLIK